jgi:lipopolysaccharide/colanic/teichoic acid biosynthesis glycosyltransferase
MLKLLTDFAGACIGLILVIPVMVISMLLILLVDRQNPVFVQERLGKSKRLFWIVKLRTMKNNQVTKLGKVLRKTGIDEVPQLVNILCFQMSFVGPRPITQFDVDRLGWNDAYHAKRWKTRPGLTGLAQLSPSCNKRMSWFLDQKYVSCQHFWLDLKIIVSSLAVLFVGKKKVVQWLHVNKNHEGTR